MKPVKRFRVIGLLASRFASWRNVARNSFLASCNLSASFPPLLFKQTLSDDAHHPVVKAVRHENRHGYRWFSEGTYHVAGLRVRGLDGFDDLAGYDVRVGRGTGRGEEHCALLFGLRGVSGVAGSLMQGVEGDLAPLRTDSSGLDDDHVDAEGREFHT